MARISQPKASRRAYRFLLTYRQEVSEAPSEEPVWRGWVVRVPDSAGRATPKTGEPAQIWFRSLDEVPEAIRRLIETV